MYCGKPRSGLVTLDSLCLDNITETKRVSDEELFKPPPPKEEDCPICFLRMPSKGSGYRYYSCCGKTICCGCAYAPLYDDQGNKVDNHKCPFCRIPNPKSGEEVVKRMKKRREVGDVMAIYNLACDYRDGTCGYPQDYTKALELYHRAAELGSATANSSIGSVYYYGEGVEIDLKKAFHYYEVAAIGGNVKARFNLGNHEASAGDMERALKHHMIAARGGYADSLKRIKQMYTNGHATKDDYTKALQSYQAYLGEIKSDARDAAAALSDELRYY